MANNHDREPRITKEIYHDCIGKIHEWIDIYEMQPQLMQYKIIQSQNDMIRIERGTPDERLNYVYRKLTGMRDGFQLFYHCLRESQNRQSGHKDAADALEERALTLAANAVTAVQPDSSLLPPLCPSPLSSTGPTLSLASSTDDDGVCGNMVTVHHPPIEEEEREGETTTTIARLSFSDLLAAGDYVTLYDYSLHNTDFDLKITNLRHEEELLRYITRFTVAIFNSRDRSTLCLPGVLVAGLSFTVFPGNPDPVTRGEVVMATVDKADFETKLHEQLRRSMGCHGSNRLLSDEELTCVKVEFSPVSNHGNSLFTVYICPTWETCEGTLYYMWNQSEPERTGGVAYWVRGKSGCGQLLYHRVQLRATQLLESWQQNQERTH